MHGWVVTWLGENNCITSFYCPRKYFVPSEHNLPLSYPIFLFPFQDGFVEFFRVADPESIVRHTLMAFAGFAGIGATLALLIRWIWWTLSSNLFFFLFFFSFFFLPHWTPFQTAFGRWNGQKEKNVSEIHYLIQKSIFAKRCHNKKEKDIFFPFLLVFFKWLFTPYILLYNALVAVVCKNDPDQN